jgi:Zn2+/Cd2+-exporting ATPase
VHGLVNGHECRIGKTNLLGSENLSKEHQTIVQELESQGKTVIFVESNQQMVGILEIQDILRPQAKEAVDALKRMGIKIAIPTGDSCSTAQAIGQQAGVDEVYAELLPGEKVDMMKKLSQ